MRTKPLYFNIMALMFGFMVLSFPLQIISGLGLPMKQWHISLSYLSDINLIVMGIFALICYFSFKVDKFTPYMVFLSLPFVLLNNYHVGQVGTYQNGMNTEIASLIYLLMVFPYFKGENFKVLVDTKLHWWRPAKRIQGALKVKIKKGCRELTLDSYDISESGIFLKDNQLGEGLSLKRGDRVDLFIKLPFGKTIHTKARMVRKRRSAGNYPDGIGVQFNGPSYFFQMLLGRYMQNWAPVPVRA
jgi:hypothetical protein